MMPDSLKVPATQTLSLETRAIGVQIYDCKPSRTTRHVSVGIQGSGS